MLLPLLYRKVLGWFVNFHYRKEPGVQCVISRLSQQLNIRGDTSQPQKKRCGTVTSPQKLLMHT